MRLNYSKESDASLRKQNRNSVETASERNISDKENVALLRPSEVIESHIVSQRKRKSADDRNEQKRLKSGYQENSNPDKETNVFNMPPRPPFRKPAEVVSEPWTFLKVAEIIAMFYILLDTFESYSIISMSQESGGYIFVVVYFILSCMFEFPILNLFIHIGQFTGAGITKLFGMYAVIFKGVGWSLLVVCILQSSSGLYFSAERLSILVDFNTQKLVDCKEYPQYDCANPKILSTSEYCCTSIYNAVKCVITNNITTNTIVSLGTACHNHLPYSIQLETALQIFHENNINSASIWQGFISVTLITLLMALVASFGNIVFTYFLAGLGLLVIIMDIIRMCFSLVKGELLYGFSVLSTATEPMNFFTIKTFQNLLYMLIYPMMKFGVISLASFRSTDEDSFYTALPITLARKLLFLCSLITNLAMYGFFAKYPNQTKDYEFINMSIEFLLSSGVPSFVFYISIILPAIIESARTAGVMCIAVGIQRDHKCDNGWWKYIPTFGLALVLTCVNLMLVISRENNDPWTLHIFMVPIGALWICMVGFCTVCLYGELEHLLDRSESISSYSKWTFTVGAASPIYPRWIARRFPQLLIVVFSADALFKLLPLRKSGDLAHLFLGYFVMFLPITVFNIFTIVLLFRKDTLPGCSGITNWWRLVYPSVEHPSYARVFKEELVVPLVINGHSRNSTTASSISGTSGTIM